MNKAKGFFGLALAAFFIMLGIYLLTDPGKRLPDGSLPWQKAVAGWGLIIFFGSLIILAIWKLAKREPHNKL